MHTLHVRRDASATQVNRGTKVATGQNLQLTLPKPGTTVFRVSIQNRSSQVSSLVVPRAKSLQTYESWGGWQWKIMRGSTRYAPYPMPGPYIPAIAADVISLAPGETYQGELDIGDFVPSAAIETPSLRSRDGNVNVSLEWQGGPAGFQVENWLPSASATIEWIRSSEGERDE